MKKVLLDTHAFLWFIFDDPRLSDAAAACIESPKTTLHLSKVSLWEITIKNQLGKLSLGMTLGAFFEEFISAREIDLTDVSLEQLLYYERLPLHHRDPFDRMIIATAQASSMPVVTADPFFSKYDVTVIN